MPAPLVFFDLAGSDDHGLAEFYATVFDWTADDAGQFTVPVSGPIDAALRIDPPEKRLYIGVPDVTAALDAIIEAGGSVDVPRFEAPGVAVLGLFRDPAGNPMGLVEMDGDVPKVP